MNSDPSALAPRARATAYTCTPLPAKQTAHRSEQGEPLILTNLSTMRQPVLGGQIMQLRDPSAPARWTADRACGAWARNPKPGKSEATRAGLTTAHALTMACATPGCQALVDLLAARRQARAGGRARFEQGDGCASRQCSADHRPAKFRRRQLAMAAALKSTQRWLIRWPSSLTKKSVWLCSQGEAIEAANTAVLRPRGGSSADNTTSTAIFADNSATASTTTISTIISSRAPQPAPVNGA